jgi:hypothetical protein
MKRRYDVLIVAILMLFLVIAYFVGNAFVKGILLLLFSLCLIWNTVAKLLEMRKEKLRRQIFFAFLLLFNIILAISAVAVIVQAVLEI